MTISVSKTASFQFLQLCLLPMLDTAKNPMRSSSIHTQELLVFLMCTNLYAKYHRDVSAFLNHILSSSLQKAQKKKYEY